MLKKLILVLAAIVATSCFLFDDAAAQIRRYDPTTGDSTGLKTLFGDGGPQSIDDERGREAATHKSVHTPAARAQEKDGRVKNQHPLGIAVVFVDSKTQWDHEKMPDLLKIRDLIGQGMRVDFYTKDEPVSLTSMSQEEIQKNVLGILKMLPHAGPEDTVGDMEGLPEFSYDHANRKARHYGITVFPSVVYQITPEGEKKVFPIGNGIDNFMKAVNDRKRELQEKKRQ